jgi:uncharacterized membrane protein (DUF485 family)
MKKLHFHPSVLQVSYLVIYLILFCLIVYIPSLINNPIHITKKLILEEEIIEGSLLGVLFLLNIVLLNLYRKEASKQKILIKKINDDKKSVEDKLDDSFKYIGQVNVQLQQIKSIFNNYDRFPDTRNDFKKTLIYFSERVFGIVNASWVLFRIINCNTLKTISEQLEIRHGFTSEYPHISNKMIVEKQSCAPYTAVISNPQNLNILVTCILPVDKISNDERVFIQAITNEITMLFVILNSTYYKNSDKLLIDNSPDKNGKKLF